MIIYKGTTKEFKEDVTCNRLAGMMSFAFEQSYGRKAGNREYLSWNNSYQHVKNLIELAGLVDNMVCLEYEVPYSGERIDCMLFGKGSDNKAYTVLIELKQWSSVTELDDEDNFVETYTGGGLRKVPHPSQQVEGYHNHLLNFVQIFEVEPDYDLYSCAYCHNYEKKPKEGLFAERYSSLVEEFKVYCKEDVRKLAKKLKILLGKGDGFEIFNRFMQSPLRPSKKLLEHTADIIEHNKAVFSLLNEQLVAKNIIMSKVRKAEKIGQKNVIVVHGGPGTGKTVIALNVLAELARRNKTVFYGCKSKPFREALEKKVGPMSRMLFSNLTRFLPSKVEEDEFDIILIDEAHRMGKTSNFQYTKQQDRSDMPPVEQIIRCAKTVVFFIDDRQSVRSQEVGSSDMIRSVAEKFRMGYEEVQLISQFRCAGSDNYLDWLEYVLGYKGRPTDMSKDDRFEFKIFDDPNKLCEVIKAQEQQKPNSARLVAGYCWPWSKKLQTDGSLVKDVVVPEYGFAMPWEAQDNYSNGRLARGIPKWYQWAYTPGGVEQVGCIYTAQGFEFDYIGVIVGPDLKYDKEHDRLVCDIAATCDPTLRRNSEQFDTYARNIYRVLMSRGMKGCYVYFCDKQVEAYFRKHIKGDPSYVEPLRLSDIIDKESVPVNIIELEIETGLKYKEYLPVYALEAACGQFGEGVVAEREGWIKAKNCTRTKFVSRVRGKSMEPLISDGDYCIFRTNVVGSRNGKIVLVQHNSIRDPDTGGKYTVKKYCSRKKYNQDGTWQHEEIELLSLNSEYKPMKIADPDEGEFMIIAEFIETIKFNKGDGSILK